MGLLLSDAENKPLCKTETIVEEREYVMTSCILYILYHFSIQLYIQLLKVQ